MAENDEGSLDSSKTKCPDMTDNVSGGHSLPVVRNDVDTPGEVQKEMRRLQVELDEARSLVAVANYSLEESIETERRKCQEEVATLQQLMKGILLINLYSFITFLQVINCLKLKKTSRRLLGHHRNKMRQKSGD